MAFRENETERFPFDRTDREVWYGIIVHDEKFPRYSFTSSKSGKRDFINMVGCLKSGGQKYLLIGIWQGQWKADIFILDETIAIKLMGGFAK